MSDQSLSHTLPSRHAHTRARAHTHTHTHTNKHTHTRTHTHTHTHTPSLSMIKWIRASRFQYIKLSLSLSLSLGRRASGASYGQQTLRPETPQPRNSGDTHPCRMTGVTLPHTVKSFLRRYRPARAADFCSPQCLSRTRSNPTGVPRS